MKMTLYVVIISLALLGFATLGLAENIYWQSCSDDYMTADCTVHAVNVAPCREAASGRPCRVKKDFSGGNLWAGAFWVYDILDMPLSSVNTNACNWTPCPATAGRRQTFNYGLSVSRSYPSGIFDLKWKLWNSQNNKCCFVFRVKVVD